MLAEGRHYTVASMRILVNATSARLGGGITVLRNLLPALVAEDGGQNEYVVVGPRDTASSIDPRHPRVRFVAGDHGEGLSDRLVWEQIEVPMRALREGVDLIFSPGGLAVFASPKRQVLMYQNMAPFEPEVMKRAPRDLEKRLVMLRTLGIASGRLVSKVVFISRYAQRSILPLLGTRSLDSSCVYLGRDETFRPGPVDERVLRSFRLERPYLLTVSQFYFYKGFVELVRAFARALPDLPADLSLAIVGAEHDKAYASRVREEIASLGLEGRVRIIGAIPYETLPHVYRACRAFVFPSLVENFPNILIEAIASGAPTFASNRGPMAEIAADGARYFDPTSEESFARSLVEAGRDDEASAALRAAGLARVERYSWRRTAAGLLDVFREATA